MSLLESAAAYLFIIMLDLGFGTAATTGTLGANPLSFGTAGGTGLNMGGLSGAGTSLFQAPKPNAPTTLGFPGD